MAGVVRLQGLQGLRKTVETIATRRSITSSSKRLEATKSAQPDCPPPSVTPKDNWVSYGFDRKNKENDRNVTKATFFITITVTLVFGGFALSYLPDPQLRDWSQREAYVVLREREKLGLPPIDRNLVDPAKVVLPTDEELGDTEIII